MRIGWIAWLADNFGELGYSHGPLRAALGTCAVLGTCALLWAALHRDRRAAAVATGLVGVLGLGWLAFH
ncbi:hypothetical protein ABT160_29815 [Streptomyces sp. NPDC001941]|uniref:hypothetical protein n=1 Tax=Streptomyces sp. NPDC001941 TaxID=3154659 RepID=UPI0033218A3C